jgi:hypothetical protein
MTIASQTPETLQTLCVTVACQRSGTHMLREILNSNPHIAIYPEALLLDAGVGSWHHFRSSLPADRLPPADEVAAAQLFEEYMQQLAPDCHEHTEWFGGLKQSPTWVGLDIKYNQIKSVNPFYADLCSRPFLLNYVRNRQFRVIHLVRNNLFHQGISIVLANLRKVYRNYDRSTVQGKFHVPIGELLAYMNWVKQERDEFVRLSSDLHVHQCAYEDLVADIGNVDSAGAFREDTIALTAVSNFLQVPNRFHYNQVLPKVLNRPYVEFIENYDDVVKAVNDSEFSQFAETI